MKRDLVLEEVFSLLDYNKLRSERGKYTLTSGPTQMGRNKRFFITREQVDYPDLSSLIADVPDEFQSLRGVWPMKFLGSDDARNYTQNNPSDYFSWLSDMESEIRHLAVSLNSDPTRRSATDDLEFHKHDGLWKLDNLYIDRRNFKFFSVSGVQPLSYNKNQSAFVLCVPQEVDIPLVTPIQQEAGPNIQSF